MKYYEVKFSIAAPQELMQDARDLTSALAGEAGFETFEETEEGVVGYVQQALFDEENLKNVVYKLLPAGVEGASEDDCFC